MSLSASQLNQYHVFLASPGDVSVERQHVRQFFERYNRYTAQVWNAQFEVVDWKNYSTMRRVAPTYSTRVGQLYMVGREVRYPS